MPNWERLFLNGLVDFRLFCQMWDKKYERLIKERSIPLKKGALELLNHFRLNNLPMAVATSTATHSAKAILKNSGIFDFFRIVIGGDQVSKSKPSLDIYLKAAAELSSNPKRCLALEDSANGVKAAFAAGMTVVQIPDLVPPDSELMHLGHILLDDLSDVINYNFSS